MTTEILIIDDNADIRNIINDLIIDAGFKTRIAANYNQALTEIDKKLPDVAIIDVKLDKGDSDGLELLLHIKKKDKNIPVIIITGHANIEMAIKALKSGAFEFIEKPFNQERLINFVNRAAENIDLKNKNKEFEDKLFYSYEIIGNSKNTKNCKISIVSNNAQYLANLISIAASKLNVHAKFRKTKTYKTKRGIITMHALYILCSRKNRNKTKTIIETKQRRQFQCFCIIRRLHV